MRAQEARPAGQRAGVSEAEHLGWQEQEGTREVGALAVLVRREPGALRGRWVFRGMAVEGAASDRQAQRVALELRGPLARGDSPELPEAAREAPRVSVERQRVREGTGD